MDFKFSSRWVASLLCIVMLASVVFRPSSVHADDDPKYQRCQTYTNERGCVLLSEGSTDKLVAQVQTMLKDMGDLVESQVDGVYGPRTTEAVLKFQRRYGCVHCWFANREYPTDVAATGIVDHATWMAMQRYHAFWNEQKQLRCESDPSSCPTEENPYAVTVTIDGDSTQWLQGFPQPIMAKGDRILVPMRPLLNKLGIQDSAIHWDDGSQTVTVQTTTLNMKVQIGDALAEAGDDKEGTIQYMLDVPAAIIDGRTYLPIRFVSEAAGASVTWDGKAAVITSHGHSLFTKDDVLTALQEADPLLRNCVLAPTGDPRLCEAARKKPVRFGRVTPKLYREAAEYARLSERLVRTANQAGTKFLENNGHWYAAGGFVDGNTARNLEEFVAEQVPKQRPNLTVIEGGGATARVASISAGTVFAACVVTTVVVLALTPYHGVPDDEELARVMAEPKTEEDLKRFFQLWEQSAADAQRLIAEAQDAQTGYGLNADQYQRCVLLKGTRIFSGWPNGPKGTELGKWFTNWRTFTRADGNAMAYNQLLQVAPNPRFGGFREKVAELKVVRDTVVPCGFATNNPHWPMEYEGEKVKIKAGPGGGFQYFISDPYAVLEIVADVHLMLNWKILDWASYILR